MKPVLAVTMGDPGGIGPEICLKLLEDPSVAEFCVPVVVGSAEILKKTSKGLGIPLRTPVIASGESPPQVMPSEAGVIDILFEELDEIIPGKPSAASGKAAYRYLEYAVRWTQAGKFQGIVTAPLTKEALSLAGIPFPGHTDILAALCQVPDATLMLWSPRLAVAFASLHVGLARVSGVLSSRVIERTIQRCAIFIQRLEGKKPRIGVLGLNPHAGESGLFGDEEKLIVEPAIQAARDNGVLVFGPLVPDAAFTEAQRGKYDAYVALYHDQGGIPFKMLSFEDGVNVTLGLPIIRTSVDHGTAYDIVGQGKASAASLIAACRLAARLCGHGGQAPV